MVRCCTTQVTAGCRTILVDGTFAVTIEITIAGVIIVRAVIVIDIYIGIRAVSSCNTSGTACAWTIIGAQTWTLVATIVAKTRPIVIAAQRLMVAIVAIVVTVVALTHTKVLMAVVDSRAEVVTTSVIVAAATIDMPGMSATITDIECGASEIEVVAHRIAGIDAEMPAS